MSWLFGVQGPSVAGGEGPPGDGKGGPSSEETTSEAKSSSAGKRSSYEFDSAALERAAKAAKDLERSPHAKQALELAKQQETTRQLEFQTQLKEYEAQMEQSKVQQRRVAEEERRKTLEHEAQQSKHRADYEDRLSRKRQEEELSAKFRHQEKMLKQQEESTKKQEDMRRATVEYELQKRHELDLKKIEAELRAKAAIDRENRDLDLEKIRLNAVERRQTILESIKTGGTILGAGLQAFVSDWSKITATAAGLSLLAVGVYSAKQGTSVLGRYVETRLGKPSLIRDTSKLTAIETVKHPVKTFKHWRQISRESKDMLKGIVFNPSLESRLLDIAITTKNTKANRGFFRNVTFYGPPGTGKTMFAKRLAMQSGLDYAIMTGGDVAPMGRDGVSAIHKVFDWAQISRKGLLLFVDEADAFLRKRSTERISEDMRASLNAFLYRTGEQSNRFMLVLASNQPEQFDWAINDRVDEMVEFELPGLEERQRMFVQYFEQFIAIPAMKSARWSRLKLGSFDWTSKCNKVAAETDGLSGREIAKLVISWQASAYASEDGVLTEEIINNRVKEVMKQHRQKMIWKESETANLETLPKPLSKSSAEEMDANTWSREIQ